MDHFEFVQGWQFISRLGISAAGCVLTLACLGCKDRLNQSTLASLTETKTQSVNAVPSSSGDTGKRNASLEFVSRSIPSLAVASFHNGREAGMRSILEIIGGGVSCLDIDRDGLVDLAFATGGSISTERVSGRRPCLMRCTGAWTFDECTENARTTDDGLYTHGWSVSDVDHDGFEDLLLYGFAGASLWFNQGDGTFARSSFAHQEWTTAVAWLDVNQDGNLDLYLGSYVQWSPQSNQVCNSIVGEPDVCSPNAYEGVRNRCWINAGDGTFYLDDQVLAAANPAKSLGALAAEFQPGSGTGLYVANDLLANFLFTRQPSGAFEERAYSNGVALDDSGIANGSMGVALLDSNLDQAFDIFVANFEHELLGLYQGTGGDLFVHSSRRMGLNRPDIQIVAFGVVAADFDGDADEDIVVVGGHVHYHPDAGEMAQKTFYLQNDSGQRFVKVETTDPFFAEPKVGRGLAAADLDNDGDMDLIATQLLGAPRVLENTAPRERSHWITVELIGRSSPRTPVGTTVELNVGGGRLQQIRQLVSGGSYLSHSQSILHFAWPREAGEEFELYIRWPNGKSTERLTGLVPNRAYTLVQSQP